MSGERLRLDNAGEQVLVSWPDVAIEGPHELCALLLWSEVLEHVDRLLSGHAIVRSVLATHDVDHEAFRILGNNRGASYPCTQHPPLAHISTDVLAERVVGHAGSGSEVLG